MITNLSAGVRAFTSNAFLVSGNRTVLVDAGANYDVVAAIREHVDDLDAVVLTHTHPDHVGNTDAVRDAFDVDTWGYDPSSAYVDHEVGDGDHLALGDDDYLAVHTPGHKDDHLVFYADEPGVLFAGDLVFAGGSFGRTDLEEGNRETLVESIERVLGAVGGSGLDVAYTGHGDPIRGDVVGSIELSLRAAKTV